MVSALVNNATTTSGWTSSPDGRGTVDIVTSCLLTILLCCWTSVYPNVPALSDSRWVRFRDKFDLACIGLLGPEFLLGIAVGQLASARRSVKKFQKKGFSQWSLTHAFFADMGGFVLKAPDTSAPLPLDAEQMFYLVVNEHVEYPIFTKDDIDDKNKADGLARLLAIGQALWFVTSSIARPIQGLSMSTFELTTLSFIIVMFATSYCWMQKPSDVSRPFILESKSTIADIRCKAGLQPHDATIRHPLNFISRDDYIMQMIWEYYVNILHKLHIPLFSRPMKGPVQDRIRSDNFLKTELELEVFAGVFILAFSATFTAGWNFYFPTPIERILWRCASIYNLFFGIFGGAYTWIWHFALFEKHQATRLPVTETRASEPQAQSTIQRNMEGLAEKVRRVSLVDGTDRSIPIRLLFPVTILCALYCLFRVYILLEDIIGLRSLHTSAYATVNWSKYIPHL